MKLLKSRYLLRAAPRMTAHLQKVIREARAEIMRRLQAAAE